MSNTTYGKLESFDLNHLMLFISGVALSLGGLCAVIQRSKCKSFCWGCVKRDVEAVMDAERLKLTGHTGKTPREDADVEKPIKLELKEKSKD